MAYNHTALLFSLLLSYGVAWAANKPAWGHGPYRMLFEVDSAKPSALTMTLGAVTHIVHKVGIPPARLEVLAWGPGLQMLLKNVPDAMEITIYRCVEFVSYSLSNIHASTAYYGASIGSRSECSGWRHGRADETS